MITTKIVFFKAAANGVEEGDIRVHGEPGRWAQAPGQYAPIIRSGGKVYLHNRVTEALYLTDYAARFETGAVKYGRGRASAVYVPVDEETALKLASTPLETVRGGRRVSEREQARDAAVASFGYALIDFVSA